MTAQTIVHTTSTDTGRLSVTSDGVQLDGVTAESPVFVVIYKRDSDADGGRTHVQLRWFDQAIPKGYRMAGVMTAAGRLQMSVDVSQPLREVAITVALDAFHSLGAHTALRTLFDWPIDRVRVALADGSLAELPMVQATVLLKNHLDQLTDADLQQMKATCSPEVKGAMFCGTTAEQQKRLVRIFNGN